MNRWLIRYDTIRCELGEPACRLSWLLARLLLLLLLGSWVFVGDGLNWVVLSCVELIGVDWIGLELV